MNPTQDHVQLIGPWAWLGWVGFALASMLYYRLWTSSRGVALRELHAELEKARSTIAEMQLLNKQLRSSNRELKAKHQALHAEYLELRGKLQNLEQSLGKQEEKVAQLTLDVKRERELRDEQYGELVKLQAKHGEL